MASYVSSLDLTLMIDQPPSGGGAPQWGDPVQFSSTGDGAANGSTIVTTDLAARVDSDDDYVGYLVECVDAVNTANIGMRKVIYACSEAVGVVTFTTEQFPDQTKDTDTFRLIDTMTEVPWFADDTGGSAVQIQDATRNDEANDYWLGAAEQGGPYVEVVNADNVAETTLRLVTDFTQAGGIAEAALGANTAIGDIYELQCCPEWLEHGFIECSFEDIQREQYQGTMFTPADAKGRRIASGQGTLLFRGPGVGNDGDATEAYRIFSSPFDVVDGGDLTVDAGSAINSIPYDAGTAVVGRMYCTSEGDVFMCTDAGSPAVPSPTLRHAPVEDTTIIGLKTFIPPTDHLLNHHLYSKQYRGDGIIERIFGLVPRISFEGDLNQFLRFNIGVDGCDWERTYKDEAGVHTRAWRAKRPTVNPVKIAGGRIVVGGTEMAFRSFSGDMGIAYDMAYDAAAPNQVVGYRYAAIAPTGQFTAMIDSTNIELIEHQLTGVELTELLIQVGTKTGFPGVFALWGYKTQIRTLSFTKEGKNYSIQCTWKINDHDTDTSGLPCVALGMG